MPECVEGLLHNLALGFSKSVLRPFGGSQCCILFKRTGSVYNKCQKVIMIPHFYSLSLDTSKKKTNVSYSIGRSEHVWHFWCVYCRLVYTTNCRGKTSWISLYLPTRLRFLVNFVDLIPSLRYTMPLDRHYILPSVNNRENVKLKKVYPSKFVHCSKEYVLLSADIRQ